MKYFIPAWHKQYDDWSINIPSIENYDAAEYMTVLKKFDEEIGLIITDYQPQLLSKLNQIAFSLIAYFLYMIFYKEFMDLKIRF